MSLAGALLSGDVRALARAISLAEDRDPQASQLVAEVQPHTGNGYLVGLTGAPGTGKSTLADALVKVIRDRQQTVGVIAVDPSSPFTGGGGPRGPRPETPGTPGERGRLRRTGGPGDPRRGGAA